jgi:hypothetical protein
MIKIDVYYLQYYEVDFTHQMVRTSYTWFDWTRSNGAISTKHSVTGKLIFSNH